MSALRLVPLAAARVEPGCIGQAGDLLRGGDLHLGVALGAGALHGARRAGDEARVDGAVEDALEEPIGLGHGIRAEVAGVEIGEPPLDLDGGDLPDREPFEARQQVPAQEIAVQVPR